VNRALNGTLLRPYWPRARILVIRFGMWVYQATAHKYVKLAREEGNPWREALY